jgi:hypothetical protein
MIVMARPKKGITQECLIMEHLANGGCVDRIHALTYFGVYNITACVSRLRARRFQIKSNLVADPAGVKRVVYTYDRDSVWKDVLSGKAYVCPVSNKFFYPRL